MTGFVGGGILTNLVHLYLENNAFAGDFVVTAENYPQSLQNLWLSGNKLTGFVGGGNILTDLDYLDLRNNEFADELIITAENFPQDLGDLYLGGNKLTGYVFEEKTFPYLTVDLTTVDW